MVESTAKLREEILALSGVDIMENNSTFKSTYAILDELSKKWKDLSDIQQATVTELIAGKRQGNIVSSLMTNFETARDALETSLNSSGSAMQEHEKWQKSLEAQILKLKASWQGLSQAFMSSDFLHGALDAVIGLVDGLTKLIDTFGTLPTILGTVAAGFSMFKNQGLFVFDKGAQSIQLLGTQLTGLKGKYTQIQTAISRYNSLSSKSASFQEKYNNALANSSTSMGGYLRGLNGAKASMGGYITHLVGATVKTIALQAATIALNMALTMGIGALISLGVQALDKLIVTSSKLAEKVDELTSKFKEQHNELTKLKGDYDTTNESSMISKYEKLSKGVDSLGRNVSLTSEEYSEYQSIVNSIAEQMPSLVSGYDEQGNALLSCKGNVEALTEAYEKLIHAQNQEILTNTGDIEKDFANTIKKANGETWWGKFREYSSNASGLKKFLLNANAITGTLTSTDRLLDFTSGNKMTNDTAKALKDLLNTDHSKIEDVIAGYDEQTMSEIETTLKDAGIDVGFMGTNTANALEETLKNDSAKIKGIVDNFYARLEETIANQKTIATAKLSEAFDVSSVISGLNYGDISEELQAIAYQTVNSFDYDFLSKLSESGKTVEQWTTEMLNQLNAISKADNAEIEAAFDLQTQFNGGEISYGEYVKSLKDVQTVVDGLNLKGEAKEQLEISLGLDDEGIVDQYEALVKRLTDSKNYDFDVFEDQARKLLDGLSSEELSVAVGVITDMSNNDYSETAEEIRTAIERELSIQGLSLDLTVEKVKLNAEALTTAITESFSGSGLSSESISAIEGIYGDLSSYDSSRLFERTANGIRLNRTELSKLNDERKNTDTAKINKEMNSLGDIYNQTREELYRLSYGTDEYNAKLNDLNDIERQINDLEKLAAGVAGVTSAFQEWQMVESAGSERDMYETVLGGIETMADEIDRGWIDDGTIELLELLTGRTDLATMSAKELKKVYKDLDTDIKHTTHSIKDFFTVDEDGNSTSKGVFNFLDAIGQMEEEMFGGKDVVKRDKNNKIIGFDFQIVGGNEVIAEALGISEELVEIMVRAADDAGFVVSMDGTYQQLDVLREKAQEASVSLNKVLEKNGKKGFDFNFNSSDVDDITKQLTEAKKILDTFRNTDGTINTKLEGADEALTVASTLQSMLDRLSRPTYMDIEVNQVEDDLQEPLRNLQELRTLTEQEHQVKLSGGDTTKLTEDINELYTELDGLPDETKIELGLVDDKGNPLTGDALKNEINDIVSGKTELGIKATVDIQMEMDDKLGILVDKALLDAGIIDKKEFNKRVKIYLEADVDNKDAKEKTDNAVKEVAEGKGGKPSSKDGKSTGTTSGDKVEKKVDVDVKADEVDTSNVKDKTKETVEKETEENLAVETTVKLETTIEEATELIDKFEDKDILIDVEVKGLEDVKELNQNIDLATKIKGSVDNLSEYVEGAKALSELDDNISSFVTAEVKGNVIDKFEYKLNNLKVFADSAKDLDKIGIVKSEVTADIKGNVTDEFEYKLNNLKVFTDNAKDIGKIGNVESNVKATVNTGESGDVVDTFEYKLDNLSKFADGVKSLQGLDDVDISVKATVNTGDDGDVVDEFEYKLDNLGEFASHVKDLQGLQSVDVEVKATVNTGNDGDVVDTFEYKLDNLGEFASHVKELQGLESVNISVTAEVNTGESGDVVDTFEHKLNNLQTFAEGVKALQGVEDVSVTVSAKVNTGSDGDAIDEFEYKLNNLEAFAKGAKELQGLENVDVSVNAKVNTGDSGDAVDTFEYKLDNLEVFAKAVRELQGLEDVDLSVKAKINGGGDDNVTDTFEYKLDNLGEFAKHVKSLQGLENVDISVKATVSGDVTETAEYKLDNLGEFKKHAAALQNVESKKVSITANIYGNVPEKTEGYLDDLQVFAKGAKALQNTASKTVEITANIYGNVPTYNEGYLDDLQVFAKGANALQSTASKTVNIEANANGNVISGKGASGRLSSLTEFKSLVSGMSNKTVTISVKAIVDSENINKAIALLKGVANSGVFKDYNATVQVGAKIATIDDTTVKNYQAPPKEGKVKYSVDPASSVFTWTAPNKDGVVNYDAKVEALTDAQKNKTGTITYKAKISGFPVVNGTANANGTAFADGTSGKAYRQGDWGAKHSGVALVGELGTEMRVRNGRWELIGQNGAEFSDIRKGDIIFNHKQTESLLKNGYVHGRGKAFASGTVNSNGSAFAEGNVGKRTWFQKGAVGEGWSFTNILKTIGGTINDITKNITTGVVGIGEKIVDAFTIAEAALDKSEVQRYEQLEKDALESAKKFQEQNKDNKQLDATLSKNIEKSEELIRKYQDEQNEIEKQASEFVAKDLYDEEKVAEAMTSNVVKAVLGIDTETDSVLGEKSDALVQSAGELGATAALSAVGVPWWMTSGATAFGAEAENALNSGASFDEAGLSAAITAGAEILTEKIGGISFGGKTLSGTLSDALTKNISNNFVKKLTEFGLEDVLLGEGTEEVFSDAISKFGQWITHQDDKTLTEMLSSKEALDSYLESYIGGFILGEGNNLVKSIAGKNSINRDNDSDDNSNNELAKVEDTLTEAANNLVATHNLTQDKYKQLMVHDAIPSPSIAIQRADYDRSSFGGKSGITFVFGQDTIDPRVDSRNKIYGNDAATPMTSSVIEDELDASKFDLFVDAIDSLASKQAGGIFSRHPSDLFYTADADDVDIYDPRKFNLFKNNGVSPASLMTSDIANHPIMRAAFLSEHGVVVDPVMKRQSLFGSKKLDIAETVDKINEATTEFLNEDFDVLQNWILQYYNGLKTGNSTLRGSNKDFKDVTSNDIIEAMYANSSGRGFSPLIAPEYHSIQEVLSHANRLIAQKENINTEDNWNVLYEIEEVLEKAKLDEDAYEKAFELVGKLFEGNVYDSTSIREAFEKNNMPIKQKIADMLSSLFDEMLLRKTDYFEAKPGRSISWDEIRAAIVPNDVEQQIVDDLITKGIEVRYYSPDVEGDRARAVSDAARDTNSFIRDKTTYSVDGTGEAVTTDIENRWDSITGNKSTNYTVNVKYNTSTSNLPLKSFNNPWMLGGSDKKGDSKVNGTAFAYGNWGTKKTETALTGELGQELVVYGNRYWTVGDNGAEFATIPKGAIVFNHKQTAELFKNGKITSDGGHGKVYANGTAFVEGTAYNNLGATGTGGDDYSGGKSYNVGKNPNTGKTYNKSTSDTAKDFEEVIDLIAIAIERIERTIDNLDQEANNIYKSWSSRNNALSKQISQVSKEINLQESAANEYLKAASGVGLSSSWIKKIQNGEIDVETITDEALKEKIDDYQTYYEEYLDCIDAAKELKETEASLYAQRVDNAAAQFEGVLGVIEHEKNMLEEYMSQSETQGHLVSANYYNALISNEKNNIAELTNQRAAMLAEFQTAMDSGTITKGSEAYYEMVNSIDEVTLAIEQGNTAILEYAKSIEEIKWEQFDILQDRIVAVTEEADFLIELMSSDKLHDDNGRLTDEGKATMGLHGQAYNSYMYQADLAAKEIQRLEKELAKNPYDEELRAKYQERISQQQEYILSAQQEKEAIRDLVEEGINLELDALQELIDKKNEALESERDLYEYQKRVKEQTEEIAALEKQMAAYAGDDSEEARSKIQQISVELESARQELEETEVDRLIENTAALLDELSLEYSELLNTRLDNLDALVESMIEQINLDATSISTTLSEKADSVGYTLSDSMNTIWDTNSTKINDVITTYGNKFSSAQTTTNLALGNIRTDMQSMITALNKIAAEKTKTATKSSAAVSKPVSTPTTNKPVTTTTNKTTSSAGGDGTPKEGDKVKFVSGQYYYDSYGKKPLGYHNRGGYVYITNINKKGSHPYHISTGNKLGKGDLGWLKLNQLSGYATGKQNFLNDEYAWTQENGQEFIVRPSDGAILTPVARGDSVLTSAASNNIWDMANSPAEFIKDNLNLGTANVPNNSTTQNLVQNFENVTFSMPNVHSYNELITEMQRDKSFEKLILSMTVDRLAGKSSLAKGKSIR